MAIAPSTTIDLVAMQGDPTTWVYTWTCTLLPPSVPPPTYAANASPAARHTTATFYAAGGYGFVCTLTDAAGNGAKASINVSVPQVPTTLLISPSTATTHHGGFIQFTVVCRDQFGGVMPTPPLTWTLVGPGQLSPGLYHATAVGTATITVASDSLSATATVTVQS